MHAVLETDTISSPGPHHHAVQTCIHAYPMRGGKEPLATPCQPFLLIIEPFELIQIHKVVMETGKKQLAYSNVQSPLERLCLATNNSQ